jgi:RNA polymerase sigma-70 factor (ECF subfamily)
MTVLFHPARPADPDVASASLVRAAQSGDRVAFGQLYGRYRGMVHAIALSTLSVDDAADVVQEVFLKALRQLKQLHDANAFGGWLAAIARHVVTDVLRVRQTQGDVDEPAGRPSQHDKLEARRALRVIRSLPRTYREPLMMRLVEGMTGPEIADRTGLTPGSVRVTLHRGMRLLRRRLEGATERKSA